MKLSAVFKPVNLLIVVLFVAVVGGLGYWFWLGSSKLPNLYRAENFTLTNVTTDKPESLQDLGSRVKLIEFIYVNCPDICPATSYNMAIIQEDLKKKNLFGKDVVFAGITFDPARDTPEVLRDYSARMKADPAGWFFYRGTEQEAQKVAEDYKVFVEKQADGMFVHTTRALLLVDRNNNVRKIYKMGADMNNQEIYQDIITLTKER